MNKTKKINKLKKKTIRKNLIKSKRKTKLQYKSYLKFNKTIKNKKKIGGTKEKEFLDTLFNSIVYDMQLENYLQIEQAILLYPDIVNYKIIVDGSESNLLQQAIAIKNIIAMDLLIKYGANVNETARNVKPLIVATILNCDECVGLLLSKGADVNTADEYGRTCLILSIQTHYLDIFNLLLDFGANIFLEDDEGKSAVTYAACYGSQECMEKLLEKGADINKVDKYNLTPLAYAIEYNTKTKNIIEFLLSNGARINIFTKTNDSVLHLACKHGILEFVELLFKYGADSIINLQDDVGITPLMVACKYNNYSVVKFLLEKDAKILLKNKFGKTALTINPNLDISIKHLINNKLEQNKKLISSKLTSGNTPVVSPVISPEVSPAISRTETPLNFPTTTTSRPETPVSIKLLNLRDNLEKQNKIKENLANIYAEQLIQEEEMEKERETNKRLKEKEKKQLLMNKQIQEKMEEEERKKTEEENRLFLQEEEFQKEQFRSMRKLEKEKEEERKLQEDEEKLKVQEDLLLQEDINNAIKESEKTYNSEMEKRELFDFWIQYFGNEKNINNLKKEIQDLLQGENAYYKLKEILPAYSNKFIKKDSYTNNILSLLFIIIGFLSNYLNKYGIFLMLKGGSAIQMIGSEVTNEFVKNYNSNDIDIVFINSNSLNIDENKIFTEKICKFLLWITELNNNNSILTYLPNRDITHPIFKVILNSNEKPLMDIDYNILPDDIINLYSLSNIFNKFYNINGIEGIFNSPTIINLIYERIYYLIKYSTKEELKNFKSKSFLTGKIPKSLNYLVHVLFVLQNNREISDNEIRIFYHNLFDSFFSFYPNLKQNFVITHDYSIDQLIDLCIS